MAERSQIQYQPITGPVWRAPVAESLAWQPRVQQPARALEYRRLGDFQQPPFKALYVPANLDWLASDRYAGRALAMVLRDLSVYPLQNIAPAYDPSKVEWLPQGKSLQIPVERRVLGDFQQPPFVALYQPAGLQWQTEDRYYGRTLTRPPQDFSVYPFQVQAVGYDPSKLEWLSSGRYPQIPVERRLRGDFQQPQYAALYRADGLQWTPQGKATPTPVERRVLGDFKQPNQAALFRPELLTWETIDRYAGRRIPYSLQSLHLLSPLPIPTVYNPNLMTWEPMGNAYPRIPVERRMLGDFQQPSSDTSSPETVHRLNRRYRGYDKGASKWDRGRR